MGSIRQPPARVLITGASSGIGLATAIAFGERRSRIALLARSEPGLNRSADQVRDAGGDSLVTPADVTDRDALESAIDRAAVSLGGLDVAVVNAGAAAYGPFSRTDAADFDRTIETTLNGAVNSIRLVLPHLRASEGTLIVVGSVVDTVPLPLLSAYTAAKHGLRGFVDALSVELRSEGANVSVALVSPGPVNTPFWDNVATQEGHLPPRLPLAYRAEDVAKAIISCVDRDRSGGITVGGGMVLIGMLHSLLNPISERVLARFASWARTAGEPGAGGRAIHEPAGDGRMRTDLPATRPSLVSRGVSAATEAAASITRR